jgi:hypothetical protein
MAVFVLRILLLATCGRRNPIKRRAAHTLLMTQAQARLRQSSARHVVNVVCRAGRLQNCTSARLGKARWWLPVEHAVGLRPSVTHRRLSLHVRYFSFHFSFLVKAFWLCIVFRLRPLFTTSTALASHVIVRVYRVFGRLHAVALAPVPEHRTTFLLDPKSFVLWLR